MKKWLVMLLIVIILGTVGFFVLNNYIYTQKQGTSMTNVQPTAAIAEPLQVTPISHATMVLKFGGQTFYTDPVGGATAFTGQPTPAIILVTDIHGDHLDPETISAITKNSTVIVVPQAVADKLPKNIPGTIVILKNGEKTIQKDISIEAIPMYNMPESADAPHPKGRGNGYVLSAKGERVYIAGDTGATPEMKALKDIDVAFVPMNPPYTMTVEEAAEGVLAFKPKVVHPYHYRGQDGLSDINKFKQLVESKDPKIKVELLDFYPGS